LRAEAVIESRTTFLANVTTLPPGSLLYSALVLAHRFSGSSNRLKTMEQVYGTRTASIVNFFGAGASHVAKIYFSDTLSPDQVLRKHTLFGYYSLGLSERKVAEWATKLKSGSAKGPARYAGALGPLTGINGLRWCEECARFDRDDMGFATWRVIHQLPFVRACVVHRAPLYVSCKDCQSSLDTGRQYRLPGEHCGSCRSLRFTALAKVENPAYSALISRCEDAVSTQSDEFRPQSWLRRVTSFVAAHRSLEVAEQVVTSQICTKWGVQSPDAIGELLGCPIGGNFVVDLLRGYTAKYPLVAQIIVGDVIPIDLSEHLDFSTNYTGTRHMSSHVDGPGNSDALRNVVDEIFTDYGIPSKFLDQYILGGGMRLAAASCGVSVSPIRRVLALQKVGPAVEFLRTEAHKKRDILTEADELEKKQKFRLPPSASFEDRRDVNRLRLLKLKSRRLTTLRKDVERKNPKLLAWLRRNDKEWLDENLPVQRLGNKHRQSSQSI